MGAVVRREIRIPRKGHDLGLALIHAAVGPALPACNQANLRPRCNRGRDFITAMLADIGAQDLDQLVGGFDLAPRRIAPIMCIWIWSSTISAIMPLTASCTAVRRRITWVRCARLPGPARWRRSGRAGPGKAGKRGPERSATPARNSIRTVALCFCPVRPDWNEICDDPPACVRRRASLSCRACRAGGRERRLVAAWPGHFRGPISSRPSPRPSAAQQPRPGSRGNETFDTTLFARRRLWDGGEAYINPEIDQGFGLCIRVGVAGFPSGEAYKVGKRRSLFPAAAAVLPPDLRSGRRRRDMSSPPPTSSAAQRTEDNLVITAGKFSVTDMFDTNSYAHDPKRRFPQLVADRFRRL